MGARRIAGGIVTALMLGACTTEQGPTPPTPLPQNDMTGRWTLAAPNAPACGMEFEGTPGQPQGTINPDGGCPGKFYTSRTWALAQDVLTIADDKNEPLAQLKPSGGQFTGQSTAGLPVTLTR